MVRVIIATALIRASLWKLETLKGEKVELKRVTIEVIIEVMCVETCMQ